MIELMCVVDKDVEAPVLFEDLADHTFAVLHRADVPLMRARPGMLVDEPFGGSASRE